MSTAEKRTAEDDKEEVLFFKLYARYDITPRSTIGICCIKMANDMVYGPMVQRPCRRLVYERCSIVEFENLKLRTDEIYHVVSGEKGQNSR